MQRKDLIYKKLIEINNPNGIDTQELADLIGLSRANVSHELNNLVKEGKVGKIGGRPVLFYVSNNKSSSKLSKLEELSKNSISLKAAVDQAKTAILYPPNGMNCLILGETGVGKSMFASLMHDYAVDMGMKVETSPFLTFNCADYSNNPQLLTSQLFGVKKGAFTGADSDKDGLIEKADGGILFLDEVHRLPPEGQESLFIFLDTNLFRRMGDSETRTSHVQIFCATTEDPKSALLKTFTRRLPMVIKIPSLKDRTLEERLYLIKNFFKLESIRIDREIYASLNTIRAFLSYDCPNNIGQLKSDIQLTCAKAYSDFLTKIKRDVRIVSINIPKYIKDGLYKEKEHRVIWNRLVGEEIEFFKFSSSAQDDDFRFAIEDNNIYAIIKERLEKLKSQGISEIAIESILEKDISRYFEKHINGVSEELSRKNLLRIIDEDTMDCIDDVVQIINSELKMNFNHNMYTAIALHIDTLIKRVSNRQTIVNPELDRIQELYPKEFQVALNVKTIIENHIKHSIPLDEAAYLTIFLLPENNLKELNNNKVKVIIIAHGATTATSMAEVANNLLGEDYAIGINAPLELNPVTILEELIKVAKENFSTKGFLLLVDMGSLTTFAEVIENELGVPAKSISLVSTLHVLEATRKASVGLELDNIYNDVLSVNSYMELYKNVKVERFDRKKVAIITACLTGEGGSMALKSFLSNHLKLNKDIFDIIVLNCLDKNYFKQKINKIREDMEILFIVSSFPIDMDIKQYSMYDVLNMKVIDELQESIDLKNTLINMPFILDENIENINGIELFHEIDYFIRTVKDKLCIELSDNSYIGLILHLAYVISRLTKAELLVDFNDKELYLRENKAIYDIIKVNFKHINNKYSIEVTDDEICYIIKYFYSEPQKIEKV
ncbi:MAG: transcriptional regulator [Firmicutes bacterium HGW-Firmicutes-7]|nr:MAG: transcriptional regulator [Firmicutes bacterium HGW-Firmicutes-7]